MGIMSLKVSPLNFTAVGSNHSNEKGRPNVSLSRFIDDLWFCVPGVGGCGGQPVSATYMETWAG